MTIPYEVTPEEQRSLMNQATQMIRLASTLVRLDVEEKEAFKEFCSYVKDRFYFELEKRNIRDYKVEVVGDPQYDKNVRIDLFNLSNEDEKWVDELCGQMQTVFFKTGTYRIVFNIH